ncbi:hypothetical protein MAPG_11931 [Magnaporthiopsis poae ATCC 64411]|uniref:Xylanolytic transcriptional activator regulatory domain-containing protein n=1 Tax=Magnaporthiopsis poae (strain ATCC 64411 / 73-15) TaxID=644358 RepID=A0A0C4EGI2_MAGP6|nr:hypothetical protein MAPG_11931 [Magnaporthiopsis poae ATCC 64411]
MAADKRRPRLPASPVQNATGVLATRQTASCLTRRLRCQQRRRPRQVQPQPQQPQPPPETGQTPGLQVVSPATSQGTATANHGPLEHTTPTASRAGTGLGFISVLFSDPEWRRSNEDLLRTLADAAGAPSAGVEACALPDAAVAKTLFERYLNWSHVLAPFLLRREVWKLHARVYPEAPKQALPPDLFRAYIICAIAAVIPYRNGQHGQHPEGYYRAALQHLDSAFLTRGLDSIQDLLLICRFGVYHHIGISIWDIVRLCMRLCVEQGLHSGDGEDPADPLLNQKRRRVFWQAYLMDRYSSTTLDRPFAIDDGDIEVGFPADANDEDVALMGVGPGAMATSPLGARAVAVAADEPSETSVFLFCVRLRQVSSRIHAELSRLRQDAVVHSQPHLAVGRIYTSLNRLLQDLRAWRESAPLPLTATAASPTQRQPRCLYESQEWFDLLHTREKMSLLRRAIDLIPKTNGPSLPHILSLFLRTALETIDHYVAMSRRRVFAVHTRSYFHMMFVSGVSAMYCVAASLACPGADMDAAPGPELGLGQDVTTVARGMRVCEEVLVVMSEQLPGASAYVTVFGALRRHITRQLQMAVPHAAHDLALLDSAPVSATVADVGPDADVQGTPRQVQVVPFSGTNGLADPNGQPSENHGGLQDHALGYGDGNAAVNHPAYGWLNGHDQHHVPASGPDFPFHQSALGVATPIDSRAGGGLGPAGIQQLPQLPQEELLQWVFTNDESIWGMDLMLGEYVYGDPSHGGIFNRVDL